MLRNVTTTTLLASMLFVFVAGCSDDDPAAPDAGEDFTPYLDDFVSEVVVATYGDLRDRAAALESAAAQLAASPSQARVEAAAAAWVAARAPWEASEAFLFGPAAFLALDPALDSWPVDRQQLDDVLASSLDLTPEFVQQGLGPGVRGFHTIEYLLFRDGAARGVSDVTPRQREYLTAACEVLADEAHALWEAWANGVEGAVAFGEELRRAGKSGSRYPTQRAALQEVIEGMIGICDEVANGKIAAPYDESDPALVESQFSFNSITDFANNLRSVQNVYTGEVHGGPFDGNGLDELVAAKDSQLDVRLQAEIAAAIGAIEAIPHPFRNHLDASVEIEAAQVAITSVATTLSRDVLPLFLD